VKNPTQFRQYYGGRKGYYKRCKVCEKVNNRWKYLSNKSDSDKELTEAESNELSQIMQLFDLLERRGLEPPTAAANRFDLAAEIARQQRLLENDVEVHPDNLPPELTSWLNRDLEGMTPEHLEEVYDDLQAKYRPRIGFDAQLRPLHDDTYRKVLIEILARFDEHEDSLDDSEGFE
jgi:hypothetical protein